MPKITSRQEGKLIWRQKNERRIFYISPSFIHFFCFFSICFIFILSSPLSVFLSHRFSIYLSFILFFTQFLHLYFKLFPFSLTHSLTICFSLSLSFSFSSLSLSLSVYFYYFCFNLFLHFPWTFWFISFLMYVLLFSLYLFFSFFIHFFLSFFPSIFLFSMLIFFSLREQSRFILKLSFRFDIFTDNSSNSFACSRVSSIQIIRDTLMLISGVDLTKILLEAFTCTDPKREKNTVKPSDSFEFYPMRNIIYF